MSRARHHRNQEKNKAGKKYGGKYKCNRLYGQSKCRFGKDLADSERRKQEKVDLDKVWLDLQDEY